MSIKQNRYLQNLRSEIMNSKEEAIDKLHNMVESLELERADGVQLISRYRSNDKIISLVGVVAVDDNSNSDITIINAEDTYVTKDEFNSVVKELKELINKNSSNESGSSEDETSYLEMISVSSPNECEVRYNIESSQYITYIGYKEFKNFHFDSYPQIILSVKNGEWDENSVVEIEIKGRNLFIDKIENNTTITEVENNVFIIKSNTLDDSNGSLYIKYGDNIIKILCVFGNKSKNKIETNNIIINNNFKLEDTYFNIISTKDGEPYPYINFETECDWVSNFEIRNVDNKEGNYCISFDIKPNNSEKRYCYVTAKQKNGFLDKFTIIQETTSNYIGITYEITDTSQTIELHKDFTYEFNSLKKSIIIGNNGTYHYDDFEKIGENTVYYYGVSGINDNAFANNNNIKYVILNDVITIGNGAFYGCESLESITIPNTVSEIGMDAFGLCFLLKEIYLSDNIKVIKEQTFQNCKSLTSITIPDSVIEIGKGAFLECESLESITIPDTVKYIGNDCFYRCKSLTSIIIPDSISVIFSHTFDSCESLKSITIPNSVTTIDYQAFSNCTSLSSITIPNSVTEICGWAFANCSSLSSITFNNESQLSSIGDNAFESCSSLTSITIPNSVTSIGNGAFYNCTSLSEITCLAETAPILFENPFMDISYNGTLKVSYGSDYSNWMTYLNEYNWNVEYIDSTIEEKISEIHSICISNNEPGDLTINKIVNDNASSNILKSCERFTINGMSCSGNTEIQVIYKTSDDWVNSKSAFAHIEIIGNNIKYGDVVENGVIINIDLDGVYVSANSDYNQYGSFIVYNGEYEIIIKVIFYI